MQLNFKKKNMAYARLSKNKGKVILDSSNYQNQNNLHSQDNKKTHEIYDAIINEIQQEQSSQMDMSSLPISQWKNKNVFTHQQEGCSDEENGTHLKTNNYAKKHLPLTTLLKNKDKQAAISSRSKTQSHREKTNIFFTQEEKQNCCTQRRGKINNSNAVNQDQRKTFLKSIDNYIITLNKSQPKNRYSLDMNFNSLRSTGSSHHKNNSTIHQSKNSQNNRDPEWKVKQLKLKNHILEEQKIKYQKKEKFMVKKMKQMLQYVRELNQQLYMQKKQRKKLQNFFMEFQAKIFSSKQKSKNSGTDAFSKKIKYMMKDSLTVDELTQSNVSEITLEQTSNENSLFQYQLLQQISDRKSNQKSRQAKQSKKYDIDRIMENLDKNSFY